MIIREAYPYSLDRQTEHVFLSELAHVLDVLLWRADEIEGCVLEQRDRGLLMERDAEVGWWTKKVSGSTRLFGSIEGFLGAWARASLILYPKKKASFARGEHLRAALGIRDSGLSAPLDNRNLRNGWMHLDEDLDRWSLERDGEVTLSAITRYNERSYDLAQEGAVRVVDIDDVAVLLPLRGIWRLRPLFHRCKDLRDRVQITLATADRWLCYRNVCGLPVGWGGEPQVWMVKSLGGTAEIVVEAPTYREVKLAFVQAVDQALDRR